MDYLVDRLGEALVRSRIVFSVLIVGMILTTSISCYALIESRNGISDCDRDSNSLACAKSFKIRIDTCDKYIPCHNTLRQIINNEETN